MTKIAMYILAGGGARGAYQSGVLKGLNTIGVKKIPLDIISGVRSGGINGSVLAEQAVNFPAAVAKLKSSGNHYLSKNI